MHKLAKGLKKKKKPKKGKKGAEEDEFNPEELERYRRERAEALEKAAAAESTGEPQQAAGSDEWKKFQALTAGVDSILKKTQGDLDRIKSTSFFQRVAPVVEEKKPEEDPEVKKNREKRYLGFDKDGNPIEQSAEELEETKKKKEVNLVVSEEGFVEVPEDDEDQEDSDEEDIFDTTYVDVLQNIDVQLAYIPESPTEEEAGDDPFDTTSADKVLKTVDKRGKKVVSLGNAVEVLSGRIDHVSTCKISRPRKVQTQDLLLGDEDAVVDLPEVTPEPVEVQKTLLDDDSDLPDVPIDLTQLPSVLPKPAVAENGESVKVTEAPLDISEFEIFKEKTLLEEIPDLDDDFDLNGPVDEPLKLDEADDPFAEKESEVVVADNEIPEVSFEAATIVGEDDPFDTAFAENLIPGKAELKFIEKELEELPESEVSISLTDPAGLRRDYETGLLTNQSTTVLKKDLLGGSQTDLSQLADQPIAPAEELTYVDPFDTSNIQELPPGKTELKFLEKELLGEVPGKSDSLDDDEFDPRKEEIQATPAKFSVKFDTEEEELPRPQERKPSRPEALGIAVKSVAFELPTPSQRPDLLITSDEEKSITSKPLTPYYSQKSLEETLPDEDEAEDNVDPFDTSFVSKVTPGKTELKLIESELLTEEAKLTHSLSDHDFNPRSEPEKGRRQSDFGTTSVRPKSLKFGRDADIPLLEEANEIKDAFVVNEAVHKRKKFESKRQESLLDADVAVDAKPLTPKVENKVIEEEEEAAYVDPFDTSIATNILPGKAELKLLENELSQVPSRPIQPVRIPPIDLNKVSAPPAPILEDEDDFDPRAGEVKEAPDFLSNEQDSAGGKVLTPLGNSEPDEDIDPFDTSFAAIGPGRTELKLLESELMDK